MAERLTNADSVNIQITMSFSEAIMIVKKGILYQG